MGKGRLEGEFLFCTSYFGDEDGFYLNCGKGFLTPVRFSQGTWKIRNLMSFDKSFSPVKDEIAIFKEHFRIKWGNKIEG